MKKIDTSKKLLLFVTIVFLLATIANYYFIYLGMSGFDTTYAAIIDIFKFEIMFYTGKSGAENVAKITQKKQEKIDETINKI